MLADMNVSYATYVGEEHFGKHGQYENTEDDFGGDIDDDTDDDTYNEGETYIITSVAPDAGAPPIHG